jgi:RNA polymerase primary sigma factor
MAKKPALTGKIKRPAAKKVAKKTAAKKFPAQDSGAPSGKGEKPERPDIGVPPKAQERSLGEDTLSIYLHELGQYNVLSREEEHEFALKSQAGDEEAFNHLVRSNLRYVVSVANRYKGFGLSLEDLINEGNIGLIHAIKRFDPDRGVKLITYAVWWIRQSIMHSIADHTGTVRLPIKQAGLMHKITTTHRKFRQEFGREATSEELSEKLELKSEDIENVMRVYRRYLSLDAPISESDETSYLDMLEEKNAASTEDNVFQHSLEDEIGELLEDLEPREKEIIRMRYGFNGDPMTLEEIGKKIGLSRERIRQIEKKAIRRFRARAKNKTLLDFLR